MRIFDKCSVEDKEKLKEAGFEVQDKEYTSEEIEMARYKVTDYIMNQSTKQISKLNLEYGIIFEKIS